MILGTSPIVTTKEGPIQGFINNGVAEFLGVPYAAPPVGNLRWMPPKNHAPWTTVLKATAYAPTCAQVNEFGVFAGPANNNDDCLYLNVFTPNLSSSAKLPVIVWVHGGGNVDGESNDYDGSKLAADGKTVVVTINYRLGALGWFAHPALDAEGHLFADYGLLDQQLVLKWVKRNIAEFGGDKNNVTLGGQSAGSLDTEANMVSPLAAGLFQRAIWESAIQEPVPLAFAETLATNFGVAAGCGSGATPAVAKCLRKLTIAQVLALQAPLTSSRVIGDGQILPADYVKAFQSGTFNHVPVISGTVHDEQNFGLAITEYFSGPPRVPFTAADYKPFVTSLFSGNAGPSGSPPAYPAGTVNKVLAQYPLSAYATPQLAMDRVGTDGSSDFPCAQRYINRLIASQVPLYAYEFTEQTAPFYFPKMPGFQSLAYQNSDILYLFPLYHGGPDGIPHALNNKQSDLSDQLVAAWTNFAWTGNPNGLGNSPWPRYRLEADKSYYWCASTNLKGFDDSLSWRPQRRRRSWLRRKLS